MRTPLIITVLATMLHTTGCSTHHQKQTSTTNTIKPQNLAASEIEETLIKPSSPTPNQNNQQPTPNESVKVNNGSIVNTKDVDCLLDIVLDDACDFKNGIKLEKNLNHPPH